MLIMLMNYINIIFSSFNSYENLAMKLFIGFRVINQLLIS